MSFDVKKSDYKIDYVIVELKNVYNIDVLNDKLCV